MARVADGRRYQVSIECGSYPAMGGQHLVRRRRELLDLVGYGIGGIIWGLPVGSFVTVLVADTLMVTTVRVVGEDLKREEA